MGGCVSAGSKAGSACPVPPTADVAGGGRSRGAAGEGVLRGGVGGRRRDKQVSASGLRAGAVGDFTVFPVGVDAKYPAVVVGVGRGGDKRVLPQLHDSPPKCMLLAVQVYHSVRR